MTEVCYIAPDTLDDEHAHAFLCVGDTVHTVPTLPEVEFQPNDRVYFNGPLIWSVISLGKRLIVYGPSRASLLRHPRHCNYSHIKIYVHILSNETDI